MIVHEFSLSLGIHNTYLHAHTYWKLTLVEICYFSIEYTLVLREWLDVNPGQEYR